MAHSEESLEKIRSKVSKLTGQLQALDKRLTSVSRTTEQTVETVTKAVKTTWKTIQAVPTLLGFDEINRLTEKTVSGSSTGTSGSSAASKEKSGQTEQGEIGLSLEQPAKEAADAFWSQFSLGLLEDEGGLTAGQSLVERLGQGIASALGNAVAWVGEHLWSPIQTGWLGLGALTVSVGAKLSSTAGELWSAFRQAWQSGGERAVQIKNALASGASALWQSFKSAWGVRSVTVANALASTAATLWKKFAAGWGLRSVTISNTLVNTAADLWKKFRSGWTGKTLGLKITYDTNVGAVKRAVYKALGLSGWPTIGFAARGGIVDSATLLGSTVVGEDGQEAIIPLENHTEWLDKVASRLAQALGGGTSGAEGRTIVVQVLLDGSVVGQTAVDYINGRTHASGASPLAI